MGQQNCLRFQYGLAIGLWIKNCPYNNKENLCEKIILQDADDNIDLDGIDWPRWWKDIIILVHISCIITFEFNKFEHGCYKHKLFWFI